MPHCQWTETVTGEKFNEYTCQVCKTTARSTAMPGTRECGKRQPQVQAKRLPAAPGSTLRAPAAPDARELELQRTVPVCIHRGEIIESKRPCKLCGAKGELYDLYACALHGKCSLGKRASDLKMCHGCPDATPVEAEQFSANSQS